MEDTVRNLRTLSESPGDVEWRRAMVDWFEGTSKQFSKFTGELQRLDLTIKHKMLSSTEVAKIVHAEMATNVQKLATLEKIIYGVIAIVVTILTAIVVKWIAK